jgi:hypothetical protein
LIEQLRQSAGTPDIVVSEHGDAEKYGQEDPQWTDFSRKLGFGRKHSSGTKYGFKFRI